MASLLRAISVFFSCGMSRDKIEAKLACETGSSIERAEVPRRYVEVGGEKDIWDDVSACRASVTVSGGPVASRLAIITYTRAFFWEACRGAMF